jgi:hypothetical protein
LWQPGGQLDERQPFVNLTADYRKMTPPARRRKCAVGCAAFRPDVRRMG